MTELGIEVVSDGGSGIARCRTGLHSLDWALRDRRTDTLGVPLRTIWEIYGKEHVGKSTLAYYLAAAVEPEDGHVMLMDVDEAVVDTDYITKIMSLAEFSGTLELMSHVTSDGKPRTDDEMLDELTTRLKYEGTAGILDAVSAYQATVQSENDLGEGFGGAKRANILGEACNRLTSSLRYADSGKIFIFTNHQRDAIGGRGHSTPGGQAIKDRSAIRIRLWRKKQYHYDDDFLGYMAEGKIVKNRYGGKGNEFRLFFLEGRGLHLGMTAVMDCELFDLASFSTTVKLHGESQGYIKADLITAAIEGEDEPFEPFHAALEEYFEQTESTTGISETNEEGK